jgi:Glycosyl hydrolases family 16/Calx-beta domain
MRNMKYLQILSLGFLLCNCKSDAVEAPSVITGSDVSQYRKTSNSEFEFKFSLDKVAAAQVSFQYATSAGTAKENVDYMPSQGTFIIPAGSQNGSILVKVIGDSTRKANQDFSIELSNPKNGVLQSTKVTGTIRNEDGTFFSTDNTGYITPDQYAGYTLAWSDEFSGKSINGNNWSFEMGNNNGWGNRELEYYTDRLQNAFVSQGNLIIEARKEEDGSYTSTRMVTKAKQTFKLGRIDIRAKLPKGKGIWPALWMLGSNIDQVSWPACGEIDIMELLGQEPNKVYGTLHWGATTASHQSFGKNYMLGGSSFYDSFHVFSMEWTASSIQIYVDNAPYFTMDTSNASFPFNDKFFFIFNVAVGGDWPGSPDSSTVFPQRMLVDYVRVFQK